MTSREERIEGYLELAGATMMKGSGENIISTCPFHDDRHRSFSMNVETGQFLCFSESCGIQGGLFAFLLKGCGLSSKKAKQIAEEWSDFRPSITGDLEFPDWENRRKKQEDKQVEVQERLLGLYNFCPRYMLNRGFDKRTLRRWEIGYDFETECVTFPVRDERGALLGFSKRKTKVDVGSKYVHLGFKRSRTLYGEFFIPPTAREVWAVEGQPDALALWQMGIQYPTSTMSANVGPRQIRRLRSFRKVVLCFDFDSDGISATSRVGDSLLETGHRNVFVAREYPDDLKDPADVLKKGTQREKHQLMTRLEPYEMVRIDWSRDGLI